MKDGCRGAQSPRVNSELPKLTRQSTQRRAGVDPEARVPRSIPVRKECGGSHARAAARIAATDRPDDRGPQGARRKGCDGALVVAGRSNPGSGEARLDASHSQPPQWLSAATLGPLQMGFAKASPRERSEPREL